MRGRSDTTSPAEPVGAVGTAGDELAPVDAPEPEDVIEATIPAPIFPTDADVAIATIELLDARPELAHASERAFTRELQAALDQRAQRLGRYSAAARARAATERQ